ncbi:MAG: zinc dependent phospholipase C family protein [Candidatus Cloacimonadota bacterium]|nr:zinc dependent phospholipase C family protein [Candidatus Cloacimonadota bacterium]
MWNWDSRTHQFISFSAAQKCNYKLKRLIKSHQEYFILGIEAPDKIFRDVTNHYYNCTPNSHNYHYGRVVHKINEECNLIIKMMKNPHKKILHRNIEFWLKDILDSPIKRLVFELGVISHYIADLHQPLHTDGSARFADEIVVHKIFEADTRKHLDNFILQFNYRRNRIEDPFEYFFDKLYEVNEFYDHIINSYYLPNGKVKADRWENVVDTVNNLLAEAAQNIANIYLSFEDFVNNYDSIYYQSRRKFYLNKSIKFDVKYNIVRYKSGSILLKKM